MLADAVLLGPRIFELELERALFAPGIDRAATCSRSDPFVDDVSICICIVSDCHLSIYYNPR